MPGYLKVRILQQPQVFVLCACQYYLAVLSLNPVVSLVS